MLIRLISTSRAQQFSIPLADNGAIKCNSFIKMYLCILHLWLCLLYIRVCLEHRGGLVYGKGLQKFSLKVKVIKAVRLTEQEDMDATTHTVSASPLIQCKAGALFASAKDATRDWVHPASITTSPCNLRLTLWTSSQ